MVIIVALILGMGIMLVFIGLATSGRGSGISARLERYTAGKPEPASTTAQASVGLGRRARPERGPGPTQQDRRAAGLRRPTWRATSPARTSSSSRASTSPSGSGRSSRYPAVPGHPRLSSFPPLRTPIALLIGALLGAWLPRFWLSRRRASRLTAFNKQLPDTITLIANALRAGSSFLQAIEMVVREAQPPITTEFGRVVREVNLGLAFDVALENMVRRVRSDDLELMATAITIQHQVGGNLAEILDSIAFTIRERVRIKGEIRTLTAQQRMSGYVVAVLPIGLVGVLFVIAPKFMEPMFMNPPASCGSAGRCDHPVHAPES